MTTFRSRRNARTVSATAGAMLRPRRDAASTRCRIAVSRSKGRAGEALAARLAVLGQEVAAQPIDERAKRRLLRSAVATVTVESLASLHKRRDVVRQHRELRMRQRAAL